MFCIYTANKNFCIYLRYVITEKPKIAHCPTTRRPTSTTGFGITMTVWTVMQSTTTEMTWLSNKIHQDYQVTAASRPYVFFVWYSLKQGAGHNVGWDGHCSHTYVTSLRSPFLWQTRQRLVKKFFFGPLAVSGVWDKKCFSVRRANLQTS